MNSQEQHDAQYKARAQFQVRLPNDLHKRLKRFSLEESVRQDQHVSMNTVITQALEEYMGKGKA